MSVTDHPYRAGRRRRNSPGAHFVDNRLVGRDVDLLLASLETCASAREREAGHATLEVKAVRGLLENLRRLKA